MRFRLSSIVWFLIQIVFLLDVLLDLLAGLLDEGFPIGQVLLNELIFIILGRHILFDVVIVEVFSLADNGRVRLVLKRLKG